MRQLQRGRSGIHVAVIVKAAVAALSRRIGVCPQMYRPGDTSSYLLVELNAGLLFSLSIAVRSRRQPNSSPVTV